MSENTKTCEYIKLELCGLTTDQAKRAQKAILSLIQTIRLNGNSSFIREREDEEGGWFIPVFSTTGGVVDDLSDGDGETDEFTMSILLSTQQSRHLKGFPTSVNIPMSCEARAQKNHCQSLERLNERGGLSPCEIIALMRDQEWRELSVFEIVDGFREFNLTAI